MTYYRHFIILMLVWGAPILVTFRDPASSRLTINRHRNVALRLPLAVFAPNAHSGVRALNKATQKPDQTVGS